jgi:hypothetical protein
MASSSPRSPSPDVEVPEWSGRSVQVKLFVHAGTTESRHILINNDVLHKHQIQKAFKQTRFVWLEYPPWFTPFGDKQMLIPPSVETVYLGVNPCDWDAIEDWYRLETEGFLLVD